MYLVKLSEGSKYRKPDMWLKVAAHWTHDRASSGPSVDVQKFADDFLEKWPVEQFTHLMVEDKTWSLCLAPSLTSAYSHRNYPQGWVPRPDAPEYFVIPLLTIVDNRLVVITNSGHSKLTYESDGKSILDVRTDGMFDNRGEPNPTKLNNYGLGGYVFPVDGWQYAYDPNDYMSKFTKYMPTVKLSEYTTVFEIPDKKLETLYHLLLGIGIVRNDSNKRTQVELGLHSILSEDYATSVGIEWNYVTDEFNLKVKRGDRKSVV